MSAWREAWQRRSPGERTALAWGAGIVLLLVLATLVWLPLERTRARLARELPALRASVAALERDAQEVQRLRAMPPVAPAAALPLSALAANASLAGASVTVLDARRVRVTGADVGFTALLDWLRGAQASHGLRVETARIDALPARGRVKVELTLAKG